MKDKNIGRISRRSVIAGGAMLGGTALLATMSGPAFAITPAEIRSKGKLVVGIQGDNPPWGFVNTSGKQEGFDADVGAAFAKELGVAVEFVPLAVANRIPALTSGRVDILFA